MGKWHRGKTGNESLHLDGYVVTVFPFYAHYRYVLNGNGPSQYSNTLEPGDFDTRDQAKQAAIRQVMKLTGRTAIEVEVPLTNRELGSLHHFRGVR
jgi:hypothetical protein